MNEASLKYRIKRKWWPLPHRATISDGQGSIIYKLKGPLFDWFNLHYTLKECLSTEVFKIKAIVNSPVCLCPSFTFLKNGVLYGSMSPVSAISFSYSMEILFLDTPKMLLIKEPTFASYKTLVLSTQSEVIAVVISEPKGYEIAIEKYDYLLQAMLCLSSIEIAGLFR